MHAYGKCVRFWGAKPGGQSSLSTHTVFICFCRSPLSLSCLCPINDDDVSFGVSWLVKVPRIVAPPLPSPLDKTTLQAPAPPQKDGSSCVQSTLVTTCHLVSAGLGLAKISRSLPRPSPSRGKNNFTGTSAALERWISPTPDAPDGRRPLGRGTPCQVTDIFVVVCLCEHAMLEEC